MSVLNEISMPSEAEVFSIRAARNPDYLFHNLISTCTEYCREMIKRHTLKPYISTCTRNNTVRTVPSWCRILTGFHFAIIQIIMKQDVAIRQDGGVTSMMTITGVWSRLPLCVK